MTHISEEKKLEASEAIIHERESSKEGKRPVQGYEPHPADKPCYEVFGLKNSFDNISVGADSDGRMTIAVSSEKSFRAETLSSEKKRLRGSRRRIKYEHFGRFFTNAYSEGDGAFAFTSSKNLPESRIFTEFRAYAKKYVKPGERSAAPFIDLDSDIRRLSEMRSEGGASNEGLAERQSLERMITYKTELMNRFIRRLRINRRRTYAFGEHDEDIFEEQYTADLYETESGDPDGDNDVDPDIDPETEKND